MIQISILKPLNWLIIVSSGHNSCRARLLRWMEMAIHLFYLLVRCNPLKTKRTRRQLLRNFSTWTLRTDPRLMHQSGCSPNLAQDLVLEANSLLSKESVWKCTPQLSILKSALWVSLLRDLTKNSSKRFKCLTCQHFLIEKQGNR